MRSILRPVCSALLCLTLPAVQAPASITVGSVRIPLPAGAVVVPHPHGHGHFSGVRVQLEERLIVEVAALPAATRPLREYLDSLVKSRNARARPAWRLRPPEPRRVAGRDAWVLRPMCGDCQAVEVYLDFPGTRLVADWGVDGLPPLTHTERHAIAWEFVEAFRSVTDSTGTPGTPEPPPVH